MLFFLNILDHKPRFRFHEYGIKRLAKINRVREAVLRQQARKNNQPYPGVQFIFQIKVLPLLETTLQVQTREYVLYAIDSYSGELYGRILFDDSFESISYFLLQLQKECAYRIETLVLDTQNIRCSRFYCDQIKQVCRKNNVSADFSIELKKENMNKLRYVEKLIGDFWIHSNQSIESSADQRIAFTHFLNQFNWMQSHPAMANEIPGNKLISYFYYSPNERALL